jgi:aspartate aminotransferase
MHDRLSRSARSVQEPATLAMAAKAKQMQSEGINVISLSTGEPDFPTPDVIKRAAYRAIEENFTRYTQTEGIPELRRAVAEKFTRENNIPTEPREVLISAGGKHSIFNMMMTLLDPGDEVIIPSPYWVSYPEIALLFGAQPVILPTTVETRYKISPDQLRSAITPRTRLLILNSPSNPTGVMYTREELEAFGDIIAEAGIMVIADELYEKIIYDTNVHFSIGSMPALRDLAITVNGVSKAYSMTGWRIGFMRGPAELIAAAARIQGQSTSNPSSISQKAAVAALTEITTEVDLMVEAFEQRRNHVTELLCKIPEISFPRPDGAFYIFMDIGRYFSPAMPNSTALSEYLLQEHHVAVVPGEAFGDDRAIRLSYACSLENIEEGVARIGRGLAALK